LYATTVLLKCATMVHTSLQLQEMDDMKNNDIKILQDVLNRT